MKALLTPVLILAIASLLAATLLAAAPAPMTVVKSGNADVQKAANGTCDASDFDGTQNAKVLNVDDQDAGVYWNNLVGDRVYCLGIATSPGDDVNGTFLRAAQDTPPSSFPSFITTVDRAA